MDGEEVKKLRDLHKLYVKNTDQKSPIVLERALVGSLSNAVKEVLNGQHEEEFNTRKVYISTKVMKHLYDKRTAQAYDAILTNIPLLIRHPQDIYLNKKDREGDYAFTCEMEVVDYEGNKSQEVYFCSLQIYEKEMDIVTVFVFTSERKLKNYLNQCTHIWNWRGDSPSS